MTARITPGQKKQLFRFIEDELDSMNLDKEGAQRIIEQGGEMQKGVGQMLLEFSRDGDYGRRGKFWGNVCYTMMADQLCVCWDESNASSTDFWVARRLSWGRLPVGRPGDVISIILDDVETYFLLDKNMHLQPVAENKLIPWVTFSPPRPPKVSSSEPPSPLPNWARELLHRAVQEPDVGVSRIETAYAHPESRCAWIREHPKEEQ